ncbi:hypothetical protein CCMA1212_002313 [Trichoderma ghanense]|uniref:Uncharacterized protein n=1 Tax=Trichoderma ghanense TaxID=65468 RepID=A0ABY2HED8_9HYPO
MDSTVVSIHRGRAAKQMHSLLVGRSTWLAAAAHTVAAGVGNFEWGMEAVVHQQQVMLMLGGGAEDGADGETEPDLKQDGRARGTEEEGEVNS